MAKKKTKEHVIAAIRQRHQRGLSLKTVWRDDPRLYYAAKSRFGGWRKAICAAGLEPPLPWTPQRVIADLQDYHRRGLPLKATRENFAMYARAKRFFGTWRRALQAAGLAPKFPWEWTAEEVIAAIRTRQAQALPVTGVWQSDRVLCAAAKHHFGHWCNALAAAGLGRPYHAWDRQLVIERIRAYHRAGERLDRIWKHNRKLVRAARRFFGSWPDALEAAGVPHQRRQSWSKERVLQELAAWHENPDYVPPAALAVTAKHLFGSTREAWAAAGLEPAYRKWSSRRVIEAIQNYYVRGVPLASINHRDRPLADAARRYFGSLPAAVAAAGLAKRLEQKRMRKWTPQRVIAAIQDWYRSGRRLSEIYRKDRGLYVVAANWFGTWRAAVTAAGLKDVRQQWTTEKVIAALQSRQRQGLSLKSLWKHDRFLYAAGMRLFGGWHKALAAAGIAAASTAKAKRRAADTHRKTTCKHRRRRG